MDDNKIIRINVEKVDENIRVTVYNSGENIPEEELDNIWGKFYKVDKARTREYGGSGLGLSIVKAVADCLNKPCGVENLPDGVSFWIDLEYAGLESEDDVHPEETVEHAPKIVLSELPIWKNTASKASKLINSTSKKVKGSEKTEKKKSRKTKSVQEDE